MKRRKCLRCGREITACMGFTLGRDIVSGRWPVREHCGQCVEFLENSGTSQEYLKGIDRHIVEGNYPNNYGDIIHRTGQKG